MHNHLKKYRTKAGLTQLQLANKMGYTNAQVVSNWERGTIALPYKKIRKFCAATGAEALVVGRLLVDNFKTKIEKAARS